MTIRSSFSSRRCRARAAFLWATALVGCAACREPVAAPPASHIFSGGTILTLDPELAAPEALAIGGGRILAVGSRREVEAHRRPDTLEVALAGRALAPAFVDHHVHLLNLGLSLLWADEPPPHFVDVAALGTQSELAAAVAARAAALPAGSWILGKGWSQGAWGTGRLPTHELLSRAAPEHPVFMTRVDGHAGWANATALRRAGLGAATPDPPGGSILRTTSGEPAGVLLERANELVREFLPEPGDEEIGRAFRLAAAALFAQGVTEVFDAGFLGPPGVVDLTIDLERYLDLLVAADRAAPLPLRINLMIPAPSALSARLLAGADVDMRPTPRIAITHLKLFVDGALGSRGALLSHPYADDPHTHGVERMGSDELRRQGELALDAGLDVATHAIGDLAVARVLDVYGEILATRPGLAPTRLRIEHFSYAAESDFRRAAELGVVLSVNPDFVAPDDGGRAMEDARVGVERSALVYAFGRMAAAAGRLAFGSDYFTTPLPPLTTFYAATTRKNANGLPAEGWHPAELLEREDAMRILGTLYPGGGAGPERGVLRVGGPAALVLLSADPLSAPESELLDIEVEAVFAGAASANTARR